MRYDVSDENPPAEAACTRGCAAFGAPRPAFERTGLAATQVPHARARAVRLAREERRDETGASAVLYRADLSLRLRGVLLEDPGEGRREVVRVGICEDQRRTEFDDVMMGTIGTGEYPSVAEAVDDIACLVCGGLTRVAVADKVEPEEEAAAPHIAYQRIAGLQLLETREPARTNRKGVLLEALVA